MNNLKIRDKVLEMLATGRLINVHLNPAIDGVLIPQHLAKDTEVVLAFGYGCATPIPDLVVDNAGISGTLSFSRKPVFVFIPWESVFILAYDGDLSGRVVGEKPVKKELPKSPVKRPNHLRLVK